MGMGASTGAWVLSMDSDFEHLLGDLRDIFAAASDACDVVVGSRFSPDSVLLRYPLAKIVSNRLFHLVGRRAVGVRFRDLTNNLKLMRRAVVDDLMVREDGFAANAETGLLPLLLGYRVQEVPISWIDRAPSMGESSFALHRVGDGYVRGLVARVEVAPRQRPVRAGSSASEPARHTALTFLCSEVLALLALSRDEVS